MIIDNLCLILLPSPHGPILVEKEKTQVELDNYYYESNNSIPVYQFTPDTLPTEYYLNKVIAGPEGTSTLINAFDPDINNILNTRYFKGLDQHKRIFTTKDVIAMILSVRNKLYDMLPTGEITAFEYTKVIKEYLYWVDQLIDKAKNPPLIDVKVIKEDNKYFVIGLK